MEIRKDRTTRSAKADESNETGFYFFPLPVRLHERLLVHGGIAGWVEKGYPLYNKDFYQIKVPEYDKALEKEYKTRQSD